jgi:hypothetical protein
MEYPHMLYRDGVVGDDWLIVADAEEEAKAARKGYLRHDAPKKRKPKDQE